MSNSNALPDDDFESISSTNLTIKSTLSSLNNQTAHKSISKTTKTISPQHKLQQPIKPMSKIGEIREKNSLREHSNLNTKRQERGSTQSSKEASLDQSNRNELKYVFAKLQSKSVAQKLREHLVEEEVIELRPAKESKDEDVDGSTGNLKSE